MKLFSEGEKDDELKTSLKSGAGNGHVKMLMVPTRSPLKKILKDKPPLSGKQIFCLAARPGRSPAPPYSLMFMGSAQKTAF